jgi:hypothetical protein
MNADVIVHRQRTGSAIDAMGQGACAPVSSGEASWLHWLIAWAIVPLMLACGTASAFDPSELYQAKVLVTGQRVETRIPALQRGLEDVLIKVSGDPTIVDEPAVAELDAKAETLVDSYRYRDLMEGIPIHDEQGTRDRPHELTVDFDQERIDGLVRTLGREPWTAGRPRVVVFLAVELDEVTYLLAADSARGRDQRESLLAAAWKYGMPVVLPTQQLLATTGVSFESLRSTDPDRLATTAKATGGDVALVGALTWSREALGWIADWRLARKGERNQWQIRGVNFDEAFRNAMSGSLRVLSGHGAP